MTYRSRFPATLTVRRPIFSVLATACLLPIASWAQTDMAADMKSMPGMEMSSSKVISKKTKASKPKASKRLGAKKVARSTKPKIDNSQPQAMDRGKMEGMPAGQMQGMDHGKMEGMPAGQMQGMDHGKMEGMPAGQMKGMDHGKMNDMANKPAMDMGAMGKSMQGGVAPPDARDPNLYADGLTLGNMPGMEMEDKAIYAQLLLDRLEMFRSSRNHGQTLDAQGWIGGDIDKLWFKVDGERNKGKLGATRTEVLWDHAIATYWGAQAGIRHDFGDGPGRTWAALGVQGLAPYWFGVQATAYVGQGGRTALRFEPEYDLLLTQRLVLQPNVKVSLYGKNDPQRGIGSGLSEAEAGLRLRYEFSRKFAPYVGVVHNRKFGTTARYANEAGQAAGETRVVGGVRIWF